MSDTLETTDLACVGHALQRLITAVRTLRDDVNVLVPIVRRIDNHQDRTLEELRAMRRQ